MALGDFQGLKGQADNLEAVSMTPFELKRLENIAANQAVLRNIASMAETIMLKPATKPKSTKYHTNTISPNTKECTPLHKAIRPGDVAPAPAPAPTPFD